MNFNDYQQFLDEVTTARCKSDELFPGGIPKMPSVELNHMAKTNDQEMDGLTVRREHDTLVPQIYLNGYFELYENGVSLNEILADIAARYFQEATRSFENLPEDMTDYEQIKDRILVQLINRDMNQTVLKEVFSKSVDHTDLAAIFKIPIYEDERSSATIRVTKEMAERWGVDSEAVLRTPLNNTRQSTPAHSLRPYNP